MNGYVRDTLEEDISHLADNLRDEDVAELYAQTGLKPYMALYFALVMSRRMKTMLDPSGTPIGVYGVNDTHIKGLGSIWMMATPDLLKHQRQFLRECRTGISEISQGYKCVFNYTDARNTVHHKWLKWCGFTFINEHKNFGKDNETFYEFAKIT
ncbi:hypothetical protein CRP403_gp31 [Roseobacter phage CRP-403]|uniref:N-acetyltransferase domain-containing protein n=1 Tax=Roseobacter phage CRP-403 TaxID=3072849 RepID=A0AAX3ZYF6_9CAUD|nr:hypothetical protein CRP403_gp31 [Roseobacter phage CRP-403]